MCGPKPSPPAGLGALRAGHQHQWRGDGAVLGAASARHHGPGRRRQLRLRGLLRRALPPGEGLINSFLCHKSQTLNLRPKIKTLNASFEESLEALTVQFCELLCWGLRLEVGVSALGLEAAGVLTPSDDGNRDSAVCFKA